MSSQRESSESDDPSLPIRYNGKSFSQVMHMFASIIEAPQDVPTARIAGEIGQILAKSAQVKIHVALDRITIDYESLGGASRSKTSMALRMRTRVKYAKQLFFALFAVCKHWRYEIKFLNMEDMTKFAPDAEAVFSGMSCSDRIMKDFPEKGTLLMEALTKIPYDAECIYVSLRNYTAIFHDGSYLTLPTPERLTIGELLDITNNFDSRAPEDKAVLQTMAYARIQYDGTWRLA